MMLINQTRSASNTVITINTAAHEMENGEPSRNGLETNITRNISKENNEREFNSGKAVGAIRNMRVLCYPLMF